MEEPTMEDVIQLSVQSDIYLVKRELIRYTDGDILPGGVDFINPRHLLFDGKPVAKGFSHEEMLELRESIRTNGLTHPLVLYGKPTGNKALLLGSGERRKRCLDYLCENNIPCWDRIQKVFKPAAELYAYVECRIMETDDLEKMYQVAFTANGSAVDIGEAPTILLVQKFQQMGWSEEKITNITNRSITWVKECFALLGLDSMTFEAYISGELNRRVALILAGVTDEKDRQTRLLTMRKFATERWTALLEKQNIDLDEAIVRQQIADAAAKDAEVHGSEKAKQQSKEMLKRASKKVVEKQKKVANTERKLKKAKITKKVMDITESKYLTQSKLKKHWLPWLETAAKGEIPEVDAHDARLVLSVFNEGMTKGLLEPAMIFRDHNLSKNGK